MATPTNSSSPNVGTGENVYAGIAQSTILDFSLNAAGSTAAYTVTDLNSQSLIDGTLKYALEGSGSVTLYTIGWCPSAKYYPEIDACVFFGARSQNTSGTTQEKFDEVTMHAHYVLTDTFDHWRRALGDNQTSGHLYHSFCYCAHNNMMYKHTYSSNYTNKLYAWNWATKTRDAAAIAQDIEEPPTDLGGDGSWSPVSAIEYFPHIGTNGSIIWINASGGRVCRYDFADSAWYAVASGLSMENNHPTAMYHRARKSIVFAGSDGSGIGGTSPIYELTRTGEIIDHGVPPVPVGASNEDSPTNRATNGFIQAPNGSDKVYVVPFDSTLAGDAGDIRVLDLTNDTWSAISPPAAYGTYQIDVTVEIVGSVPIGNGAFFSYGYKGAGASEARLVRVE